MQADREGYIAIIMPKPADWLKIKDSLLSHEDYRKLRGLWLFADTTKGISCMICLFCSRTDFFNIVLVDTSSTYEPIGLFLWESLMHPHGSCSFSSTPSRAQLLPHPSLDLLGCHPWLLYVHCHNSLNVQIFGTCHYPFSTFLNLWHGASIRVHSSLKTMW